jgi:hypothetical protein
VLRRPEGGREIVAGLLAIELWHPGILAVCLGHGMPSVRGILSDLARKRMSAFSRVWHATPMSAFSPIWRAKRTAAGSPRRPPEVVSRLLLSNYPANEQGA